MDYIRLKYELERRGISKEEAYSRLGISRSAFYRKCTGKSEFTQREIQAIMDMLELESPVDIFFSSKVS